MAMHALPIHGMVAVASQPRCRITAIGPVAIPGAVSHRWAASTGHCDLARTAALGGAAASALGEQVLMQGDGGARRPRLHLAEAEAGIGNRRIPWQRGLLRRR